MASPILAALEAQVVQTTAVIASAIVLINGIAARVQAGIDAALANGATPEEMASLQDEVEALMTSSADLAAAVAANTPSA